MKKLIPIAFISLLSCAKTPLTKPMLNRLPDANAYKQVQLYTVGALSLQHKVNSGSGGVKNGRITMVNGEYVETIDFAGGTRCVAIDQRGDSLLVQFEAPNGNIWFTNATNGYIICATDDNKISYGGKTFTLKQGFATRLACSRKLSSQYKATQRKVKGIRVKDIKQ